MGTFHNNIILLQNYIMCMHNHEGYHAPGHDFIWLAFMISSQKKF